MFIAFKILRLQVLYFKIHIFYSVLAFITTSYGRGITVQNSDFYYVYNPLNLRIAKENKK